jgi:tetratricopeptide (TPR) repeat protein
LPKPAKAIYNQSMLKLNSKIIRSSLMAGLVILAILCWLPSPAGAQNQNPDQGGDRYCIWLFWTKDPAIVKQALERLAQGDPFMVVARDTARKNPKTSQANADCMPASGMDPAVLAVAKGLRIGELSRPFDLGGGTALVMRTTDAHRRKAQQLYAEGHFAQAERELLRDLKLHPASASAWHMLSLARTAQGNYTQALSAVDKALAFKPNNPAMLNDKASALANLGRAKQAVPVFKKAMARDPENPTIMSNLAWALTLAKLEPERALTLAKKACKVAPREARAWHTLAKVQAAQGLHSDAIISLRQTLLLAPKHKAASQDLVKSIKALKPKILARLNQDCAPATAGSAAKSKPVAKEEAGLPADLKPAPNLAGPGISLPEKWPSLPVAKNQEKPKAEAVASVSNQSEAKSESKPAAKAEKKAAAQSKPPTFTGKRIVSLPMPKFQEQSEQTALPKAEGKKEAEAKSDQAKTESNIPPAKAADLKEEAEAEAGQVKPDKPKPTKPKSMPGPDKDKAKPKNNKNQEAAPKQEGKAEAKKTSAELEPKKTEAEKDSTESPPEKPATSKAGKEAGAEAAPEPEKPHYLIQVASYRPEVLAKKELRSWKRRNMTGFIEKWADRRDRIWHRVLLGPFPTQKAAEDKARELKAKRLVRDYYVVKRPAD